MHWIGVTVLFSGIRRNDENIFLFEGSTMVSKDKNPLSVLLVTEFFSLDVVPCRETGKKGSGHLFLDFI